MKAIVINPFWDKNNTRVRYEAGQIVNFDKNRVNNLVERGLVEPVTAKMRNGKA